MAKEDVLIKALENKLVESEKRFRSLIDNTDTGYFRIDTNECYQEVNRAWLRMHGFSPEEVIGRHFSITQVDSDLPAAQQIIERLLNGGYIPPGEITRKCKDGSIGYHTFTMNSVIKDDKVVGVEGFIIDISERKRAEEALFTSEERFHALTAESPAAIYLSDIRGNLLYANRRYCEIAGLTQEEVLGSGWSQGLHPEDRQHIVDAWYQMAASMGAWDNEYRFQDRRGKITWVAGRATPMHDSQGKVIGYAGVNIDITRLKQVERAVYLMSDTQSQIAHLDNLTEIYQLVGQKIQELIGDGYVATTILDEEIQANRIVGLYGFGNLYQNLVRRFRVDPSNYAYSLDDMTAEELQLFRSMRLEKFEGGLYHLLTRKVPKRICDAAEKLLHVTDVYTMGFIWQGLHYGGISILAKRDLTSYKDMVEAIMNQATISIKRIRSEEALRKSEDRYRDLVENSQQLICTHDLEGRVLSVNHWASKMLGYELDTILQMNIRDMIIPERRGKFDEYLVEIQQFGAAKGVMHVQTAMGERRTWEYNNTLRTEGVGKPIVRAIAYDITERVHAEEALRESEMNFHTLVENIPGAVYRYQATPPWKMIYASVGLETITGYPLSYFEGDFIQQYDKIILPEDFEIGTQPLAKALMDKLPYQLEYRIRPADGSIRWVYEKGRIVCTEQGHLFSCDGVIIDITERKLAEEVLKETQKLATMGSLAAGIAHEINSPLQVITGLSERITNQLEHTQLDISKLERDIVTINRLGWSIAHIIRALLTYARETQGEVTSQDLNEIIKDTLLLTEHQLRTWENINISTDLEKNLPPLSCERNQIVQVLINLLNNARDAMPHGGEITIKTGYDAENKQIVLQITDSGMGISEDVKKKIFDPFFTTKPIGQGTGLGLSIVYGIIKAHGGDIEVISVPTKGTTMLIHLPETNSTHPLPNNKEIEDGRFQGQAK